METHEPNLYSAILGGVSRGFWSRFLDRGTQSAVFRPFKSVKRAKKTRFSKIGLKPTQKAKRMTQMTTQPFWGVFREVFGLRS